MGGVGPLPKVSIVWLRRLDDGLGLDGSSEDYKKKRFLIIYVYWLDNKVLGEKTSNDLQYKGSRKLKIVVTSN